MDIETDDEIVDPSLDPSGSEPQYHRGQPEKKEGPIDPKAFKSLQDEVAMLRRERDEARDSERYWAERARGTRQPDEEEPEREEEDDDNPEVTDEKPEQLVDDLTSRGLDALVKRGVITKRDARGLIRKEVERTGRKLVREAVAQERQKLTTDAEIMHKFPDLRDDKSALFLKTREIYREVCRRNPDKARDPEALLDAAERAQLKLEIESLKSEKPEERHRRERIAAQDVRGSRGSSFEDDNSPLGPEAKSIISQMGISEDDYNASRKQLGMRRGR